MIYTFTALFPFLLLTILILVIQRPAVFSIPVTLFSTLLGAYLVWEMDPKWFAVSAIKSSLVTLDILMIIAGVIVLFLVLQKATIFQNFQHIMERISDDRRVQAVIVSWLFVSLLEGAAGFGTPGMLAAGMLVHLGFRPILAVTIPLIGGFIATTFGAVGVPITIGIGQGLLADQVSKSLISEVTVLTALFHLLLGSAIPIVISCVTTHLSSDSFKKGLEIWKFALFAGLSFTIPMYIIAVLFGPEFPSIGASLFALFIVLYFAKNKYLSPKQSYRFKHDVNNTDHSKIRINFKTVFNTFLPYILLVAMLGISRIQDFPIWGALNAVSFTIDSILNTSISHSLFPLYSPGFFLVITALFSIVYYKIPSKEFGTIIIESIRRIVMPFVVLLSTLTLVNVLLYSDNNTSGLPNMLLHIAQKLSTVSYLWPIISPLVGMIGAFVTGSVTVSNLLFSSLQYETAVQNGYSPALILTLQTIGSSAGNMIAIHNIVTALTVVKLHHQESIIIRNTIVPAILYVFLAGCLGLLFSYF